MKLKDLYSDERGQILPMFALLIFLLLGISAIVIDGGGVFYARAENYNIAEASAISALDYLDEGSDTLAKRVATEYAVLNGAKAEDVSIITKYNVANEQNEFVHEITVSIGGDYPMIFGNIIKGGNRNVNESYTAQTVVSLSIPNHP